MGLLLGGGALGLFVGIALLAPRLVKPIALVVGWPARRLGGVAGDLAGANSVRNPSRTASSAAALMIGLTLVTLVAVLGAGMRSAVETAVSDQIDAAYVVDGKAACRSGLRGRGAGRSARCQGATHVRSDKAVVKGKDKQVSGIDPEAIGRFYNFSGSPVRSTRSSRWGVTVPSSTTTTPRTTT